MKFCLVILREVIRAVRIILDQDRLVVIHRFSLVRFHAERDNSSKRIKREKTIRKQAKI